MDRINEFITDLLGQRGITKDDMEDLRVELLDHIILLKEEYIDKGYNENEAIDLALKNFGNTNEIGNSIKRTLPSRNKYNDFSKIEMFKTIVFMLSGYFITLFYIIGFKEMNYESVLFNIIILSIPIIIGFSYVNLKLTTKTKRIKNIVISLVLFFLLERSIMLLIYLVNSGIYTNRIINFNNLLDIKYIGVYIVLGGVSIIITNILSEKVVLKVRNPYNARITSNLLWILSIALMILYYLFPNRWYLLCRLVEIIIGNEVLNVSRNLLFLTINNQIVIPNVGLIIFNIMGILLLRQINKKGIESIL